MTVCPPRQVPKRTCDFALLLGHQLFGIASHRGVNLFVENSTRSVDRERAALPSVLVLPLPSTQPPLRQILSLNTEVLSECILPQPTP